MIIAVRAALNGHFRVVAVPPHLGNARDHREHERVGCDPGMGLVVDGHLLVNVLEQLLRTIGAEAIREHL